MSLKIPRDVIKILDDINKWESENQNAINGVFQSESFGGYSYSLKSGSSNNGKSQGAISWKDIFGNKLNCYRKLG